MLCVEPAKQEFDCKILSYNFKATIFEKYAIEIYTLNNERVSIF